MLKNKTQKNLDILRRFAEKANRLADKRYDKLGMNKIDISMNINIGGKVKSNFPSNEIVESFLMNVRMFVMSEKNSDFNFEKVCHYFVEKDYQVKKVELWLKAYNDIFNNEAIVLKVNNKALTTKYIFYTIFNEDNFHQEKEQKGMATIMSHQIIESFSKSKFFNVLYSLRMIICCFNKQIVEKYLKELEIN